MRPTRNSPAPQAANAPQFVAYERLSDALNAHAELGGWLFIPETATKPVIVFPEMTPTGIMNHETTLGHDGTVLCNPRAEDSAAIINARTAAETRAAATVH